MIEKIIENKKLLAVIVRRRFNRKGVNFITDRNSPLQLGISNYKNNIEIKAHIHRSPSRYIRTTQEFLYIIRGRIRIDLFYKNKRVVTKILSSGDSILLMSGHRINFLAPTKILEIKQGPYVGKKFDKRYLKVK